MIKTIFTLFFILQSLTMSLNADWMSDVSAYFKGQDYKGAVEFLLGHLEGTQENSNPIISGLLAYSFSKLQIRGEEYRWLGEYFENYRGEEVIFDFLDESTYAHILKYLTTWKVKYPYVSEIALIKGDIYQGPNPPDKLIIGIEIEGNAYYRLSDEGGVIKGGLLKKGFNSTHIQARDFFQKSGSHTYFLDLKAGGLIVSKEVEIDVRLDSEVKVRKKLEVTEKPIENPEFKLSLYVGDELIISSQKLSYDSLPMKLTLPPWPDNARPYGPIYENEFALNSFSIADAVGAIYGLIKELKKEKKENERPIPIQKQMQVRSTFLRINQEGATEEIRATITLKTKHIKTSSF